jgi:hypothetical protein
MQSVEPLLRAITAWAASRGDIVGLALVGFWARGTAGPNSDVDLVLLTPEPATFCTSSAWLNEIGWASLGVAVRSHHDADYGVVWSRHVEFSDGGRVEFGFGYPSWAAVAPIDAGTRSVVSRGCRVLFDPARLLQSVVEYAAISMTRPDIPALLCVR